MLDASTKAQLKSYLERATQPIEIVASLDDSKASGEMLSLLKDVAEVSPLVTLTESRDDNHRKPSFSVNRPSENHGPRFAGLPMGHEFTSLILALLQIGGYPPKVEQAVLDQIKALDGDFEFEIYVSLTCHNCPDVVQALNLMAIQNPRIRTTMIEGGTFQDEVKERQIMAVPTVFLNGTEFGQGRMSLEEILAKIDTSGVEREAAKIAAKDAFDVLIVGGGPAGAAAAVYAARKGIRTGVASERFGGQVLDTLGIENFISIKETEGPKFAHALEEHVRDYDVDIMNLQRAKALVPGKDLIEVQLESGASLKSKTVIISTGARWRNINVPGEHEFKNKGVAYCPHCDGPLFKGKRVAVIGGGNSGVEAAIDLAGIVGHVTLIEFDTQLRADAVLQRKLKSLKNVDIFTNAQTTEITGDQKVNGLVYKDRASGELKKVELEGVFIQIGLVPNTDWLKGTVELTKHGEIVVDARGQTSVPGVFAAGDVTTVPFKQIIIAAGDGAKAALGAFDHLIRTTAPA
ncbi:alkyl hydroperoxide reductase subunit F [Variovorax boronicumulans]|uniref:Alkyl hydroperoxide reductase subunit F n=1 Tax=Variovorax boronicumulans TaxID=436515 RepID=A0A1E7U4A0_9BURK|nr:alkyl hydroperoxide reductase subunit F [Variovorax boronicumulans]ATA53961.1 alkyl hydroperoxide reductase subunit F [Variovorax boronicumulans]MDP9882117.1 alkyl hydroperoxide reductase subunit F [Variovorax boronicumulans]MDP9917695.1 alkyl hydroperoxide reductase subunit F [Variovorax boronicumulans]MDP9927404.1 alkyl hydroperoxide reductase subunit F [Variovorax boronicumulans]OEZ30893.1 alkyl hydroperoxide reductase [Variovorax boronicumulans]